MSTFLTVRNLYKKATATVEHGSPLNNQPPLRHWSSHPELVRQSEGRHSPLHNQTDSTLPLADGTVTAHTSQYIWPSCAPSPPMTITQSSPSLPSHPPQPGKSLLAAQTHTWSHGHNSVPASACWSHRQLTRRDNCKRSYFCSVILFLAPLRAEPNSVTIVKVSFSFYSLQRQYQVVWCPSKKRGPKMSYPNK